VRSSGRISKELPIVLIGDDLDGKVFSERTKTVLLSLHGAGVLSKHKLSPEQELILRCPERNQEAEIRVVGQLGSSKGYHTYGVAFVDSNLNFWGLDFPPISDLEREMGLISLACTSCHTVEKIDDTSIEADICATGEGVMRYCKRCALSTLWKPALAVGLDGSRHPNDSQLSLFSSPALSSQVAALPAPPVLENSPRATLPPPKLICPESPAPAPSSAETNCETAASGPGAAPRRPSSFYSALPEELETGAAVLTAPHPETPPAPEKPARPSGVERRKHPRVKVTYSACVRHPQRGDDIVLCEDMSKGGLRFKARRQYYAQTLIEVAVPYEPGQSAIFVPAQIVFVQELPEQQLYRYGVQYLKPAKTRDTF